MTPIAPRPAALAAALACALLAPAALAQQAPARPAPQRLGAHGDWTAAVQGEGASRICYAFTRAARSEGGGRRDAMLTVTHRPEGRDQVSLRVGAAVPREAAVVVSVGSAALDFFAAGENAFARQSAPAIAAFRRGREAVARAPLARDAATDAFSLSGFTAAYEAISQACPAGGGGG